MTRRRLSSTALPAPQSVDGWVFDANWAPYDARVSGALEVWQAGATVSRIGAWVIVLYPATRSMTEPPLAAVALRKEGVDYTSLSLDEGDRAAIDAGSGPSLLIPRCGELAQLPLRLATPLEPAALLPEIAVSLVELTPLAPAAAPTAVAVMRPPETLATVLGDAVPDVGEPQRAMMASLVGQRRERVGMRALAGAKRAARAMFGAVAWFFSTPSPVLMSGGRGEYGVVPRSPRAPHGPSVFARLGQFLRLAVLRSPVGRLFLSQQERYLRRLQEMFTRRDFDEALRHAIPLSGDVAESLRGLSLSLSMTPRADLRIGTSDAPSSTTSLLGGEAFGALRQAYERAAELLAQRGEYEKAAFVHIELLRDSDAGIALLEKAGRYAKAAEICEGRGENVAWAVRLWILAGDLERAIFLAADHHAFAEAIAGLSAHAEAQRVLTLRWADRLARAGQFEMAVNAVRDLPEASGLVQAWVERAFALGGPVGMELLVYAMSDPAVPDALTRPHLEGLLRGARADEAGQRLALASALLEKHPSLRAHEVVAPLFRQLLIDEARGHLVIPRAIRTNLAKRSADRALVADLPSQEDALPTAPRLVLAWTEGAGLPVHDAVPLDGGGMLLALGEAGARILRPDGTTRFRLDQPCDRLVISRTSARGLLLRRRGRLHEVARADLVEGRVEPWAMLELSTWADDFDGETWYVLRGDELLALDVLGDTPRRVWRVQDAAFGSGTLALDHQLHVLVGDPGGRLARWDYTVPARRLIGRVPGARLPAGTEAEEAMLLHGTDTLWTDVEDGVVHFARTGRHAVPLGLDDGEYPGFLSSVVGTRAIVEYGARRWVVDAETMSAALEAHHSARVRIRGDHAAVFTRGRVARIDLDTRRLWLDIAVR